MSTLVGGNQQNAGAGAFGGHNNPAPAQFQAGAVGFGALEEDDELRLTTKGYRQVCDGMARSIVRLESENEELRAEVALLREEQVILKQQLRAAEALGLALVKQMQEGK